jgi:hypothetical protein
MSYRPASFATRLKATAALRNGVGIYVWNPPRLLKQLADWVKGSSGPKMARANNSWKWREGMDATLTRMYESGQCSVGDIARQIGVTAQTVYPQLRRLGLPLLGKPGCRLRN